METEIKRLVRETEMAANERSLVYVISFKRTKILEELSQTEKEYLLWHLRLIKLFKKSAQHINKGKATKRWKTTTKK